MTYNLFGGTLNPTLLYSTQTEVAECLRQATLVGMSNYRSIVMKLTYIRIFRA